MAGSTLTITSNFNGDHAGRYIAAALKNAKSLEYMTMLENIKYKRNITTVGGDAETGKHGMIQDRTCDFTAAGALTLSDKVLEPKRLQVNYKVCKGDLIKDWQALQMKPGQWNINMGADFQSFLISHVAGIIAESTENSIWTGAKATGGEFEGFTTAGTGVFVTDAVTAAPAPTGGAYAAGTIIADLAALLAAVPSAVYGKMSEDLYMYMNPRTYRIYINAVSAAGYVNAFSMNDTYQPFFEGVKIAVCPGMPDNNAVVALASSLMFGTDLYSDETEIKIIDESMINGSDNILVAAKFTAGVQSGIAKDITWQK